MAVGIAIFLVCILVCVSMIVSESRHQVRDLILHLLALAVLGVCFFYSQMPITIDDGRACLGRPRLRPVGVSGECQRADYLRLALTVLPTLAIGALASWSMWRGGRLTRDRGARATPPEESEVPAPKRP